MVKRAGSQAQFSFLGALHPSRSISALRTPLHSLQRCCSLCPLCAVVSSSDGHEHVAPPSDQRRYLPRYRNLQHGWPGFAPRLDRGFFDLLKIVETDGVAPVPLRDRNNVKAGNVEIWNSRRLLKYGERFQNAVLVITRHDDQYRKTQLRRRPQGLNG